MATLAEDPGGFQAGRPPSDDHRGARRTGRGGHTVGHPVFASGGCVVHALGVPVLVDLVETVAGAHTWPDPVFFTRLNFRDDVRVGDVRARHSDEVEESVADRVPGGGDVVDARRVHHRDRQCPLDLPGELEVRRDRCAHRRDHPRERLVAGHVSLDHADEVDAFGDDALGDLHALVQFQATGHVLVEGHPDADDEVGTRSLAHRANHPQWEPKPVLDAAHAVLVIAMVGQRRPERVQ